MARSIAQTLTLARLGRNSSTVFSSSSSALSSHRLLPHRTQSNQSSPSSDLTDLDSSSSSSNADPLIRKLEDAIHRILVRRSAPDWLPFLPGSSYWVPPPRSSASSNGLAQLLDKLANPMTDDESMSVTTVRGWPSSSYFIEGAASHPLDVDTTTSDRNSQPEDEQG